MVLGLAALAATAASFPTGFGFGAGYGAGVRVGYDIIYPKIAPALRSIAEDIIGAVNKLFGEGGGVSANIEQGFDFAAGDPSRTGRAEARFGSEVDLEDVAVGVTPTAPGRKSAIVGDIASADVKKHVSMKLTQLSSGFLKQISFRGEVSRTDLENMLVQYQKAFKGLNPRHKSGQNVRNSISVIVSVLNRVF